MSARVTENDRERRYDHGNALDSEEEEEERRLSAKHGEAGEVGGGGSGRGRKRPPSSSPSSSSAKKDKPNAEAAAAAEEFEAKVRSKKSRPTLKAADLLGADRGLLVVRREFPSRVGKFRAAAGSAAGRTVVGTGARSREYAARASRRAQIEAAARYSRSLMSAYRGYARDLFPALAPEDVFLKIEAFGSKNEVKAYLQNMREEVRKEYLEGIYGAEKASRMLHELEHGLRQRSATAATNKDVEMERAPPMRSLSRTSDSDGSDEDARTGIATTAVTPGSSEKGNGARTPANEAVRVTTRSPVANPYGRKTNATSQQKNTASHAPTAINPTAVEKEVNGNVSVSKETDEAMVDDEEEELEFDGPIENINSLIGNDEKEDDELVVDAQVDENVATNDSGEIEKADSGQDKGSTNVSALVEAGQHQEKPGEGSDEASSQVIEAENDNDKGEANRFGITPLEKNGALPTKTQETETLVEHDMDGCRSEKADGIISDDFSSENLEHAAGAADSNDEAANVKPTNEGAHDEEATEVLANERFSQVDAFVSVTVKPNTNETQETLTLVESEMGDDDDENQEGMSLTISPDSLNGEVEKHGRVRKDDVEEGDAPAEDTEKECTEEERFSQVNFLTGPDEGNSQDDMPKNDFGFLSSQLSTDF